ncbi:MAG TPA: hypothetical protein VF706_03325 [Solirubrobacteraceae bacterium]
MYRFLAARSRNTLALALAGGMLMTLMLALGTYAPRALADGPGVGAPWTATVGDSFISGEAGRWAGNTDESSSKTDALGSTAYDDNESGSGELISGCHRSKSAEVYIGSGVSGENLACSGAKTYTFTEGSTFKPGIDFYNSGGKEGQALMLQHFAASHNVKLVTLSIGGNNFNFAGIVTTCVEDFLESTIFWDFYCSEESSVTNNFTASNVSKIKGEITTAIKNVAQAMTNAGYSSSQYTILVQDYPSPIPNGSEFRYTQSGYSRQTTGGCGFWNKDANYANATMLPTIDGAVMGAASAAGLSNVKTMELSSAFNARRLCDKGVGMLEEEGLSSWKSSGAVDKSEWFNQIRTLETLFGPYELQEDIHPNYWAQLALRNCLMQAYNAGTPKGGTCTISGTGLNSAGEPNMSLH